MLKCSSWNSDFIEIGKVLPLLKVYIYTPRIRFGEYKVYLEEQNINFILIRSFSRRMYDKETHNMETHVMSFLHLTRKSKLSCISCKKWERYLDTEGGYELGKRWVSDMEKWKCLGIPKQVFWPPTYKANLRGVGRKNTQRIWDNPRLLTASVLFL